MTDPLSRVPGIWRPGMLTLQHGVSARLVGQDKQGRWNAWDNSGVWLRYSTMDGIEVATNDPTGATTGCLAAFCRGLYGDWRMWAGYRDEDWYVNTYRGRTVAVMLTETAAWRAAILAHPSLSELR